MELNQFIPSGGSKIATTAQQVAVNGNTNDVLSNLTVDKKNKIVIIDADIRFNVHVEFGGRVVHSGEPELRVEQSTDTRAYVLAGGWGETLTITALEAVPSGNFTFIILEKD